MPNHVKNILKMEDITTLPIFTNEKGRDMENLSFDFEKIIPMPKSLDIESSSIIAVAVEAAIRRASLANHEHFGPRVIPAMSDSDYKAFVMCFLGPDWYVAFPIGSKQVNTIILDEILRAHSMEYRKLIEEAKRKVRENK